MQHFVIKLKNNIFSPYFIIAVLSMTFMCFLAKIPSWVINGDPSILECTLNKNVILWKSSRTYSAYEMFKAYDNFDWFPILLPLIAGFTSISYLFEEQNSNYIRFVSIRSTKNKNILINILCSGISGGLTVITGVLIFGIIIYLIYPSMDSYIYPIKEGDISLYYLYPDQMLLSNRIYFIIIKLTFLFLTSYLNASFTYLCLVIFRNKFISLTVPIVTNYITTKMITTLIILLAQKDIYNTNYLYLFSIGFHYLEYQNLPYDNISYLWYIPIFLFYNAIIFIFVKMIFSRKVDYCE